MWAAKQGNNDIIKVLVAAGADVNGKGSPASGPDGEPTTPLWTAVGYRNKESVVLLLDMGADVNATNDRYFSALRTAAEKGYADIVKILLQRGAMVDYAGRSSETPLMYVMSSPDANNEELEDVAKILINAGADVNAKGRIGNTALHSAAGNNKIHLVRLLIKSGADVNIQNNEGQTALSTARKKGYKDIVSILKGAGTVE